MASGVRRVPAALAAVVVLVAAPALAGLGGTSEPSLPRGHALVELSGAEGDDGIPTDVYVAAPGRGPTRAVVLRDADGRAGGRAGPTTGECRTLISVDAYPPPPDVLADDTWCVAIGGVPFAREVRATVPGAEVDVTLTVRRQVHLVGLPLIVLLTGLIAGVVGAGWLLRRRLTGLTPLQVAGALAVGLVAAAAEAVLLAVLAHEGDALFGLTRDYVVLGLAAVAGGAATAVLAAAVSGTPPRAPADPPAPRVGAPGRRPPGPRSAAR